MKSKTEYYNPVPNRIKELVLDLIDAAYNAGYYCRQGEDSIDLHMEEIARRNKCRATVLEEFGKLYRVFYAIADVKL